MWIVYESLNAVFGIIQYCIMECGIALLTLKVDIVRISENLKDVFDIRRDSLLTSQH